MPATLTPVPTPYVSLQSNDLINVKRPNGPGFVELGGQAISAILGLTSSGAGVNFSAGATSAGLESVVFSNSNNVSFGLSGSTITATVSPQEQVNFSAGTTSGNLGSVVFSNGNGISFGLSASTITASASSLVFSNSNNVSFGTNAGTLTASASIAATVFSNSNNISFGLAGSTVTANANVGIMSAWDPIPLGSSLISNSTLGQNSIYFHPFDLPEFMNAYRLNLFASVGTSISAINSTYAAGHTGSVALYQRDTGTNSTQMTSLWSGSFFIGVSASSNTNITVTHPFGISNSTAVSTSQYASNNANASTYLISSVGGPRVIPLPVSLTLAPGRYWMGFANSTSTVSTNVGFGLSYLQHSYGQLQFRPFGTSSAASNASFYDPMGGNGTYSATSGAFPGTVALNTNAILAGVAATRVMFNFSGYTTATNML